MRPDSEPRPCRAVHTANTASCLAGANAGVQNPHDYACGRPVHCQNAAQACRCMVGCKSTSTAASHWSAWSCSPSLRSSAAEGPALSLAVDVGMSSGAGHNGRTFEARGTRAAHTAVSGTCPSAASSTTCAGTCCMGLASKRSMMGFRTVQESTCENIVAGTATRSMTLPLAALLPGQEAPRGPE